MGEDYAGGYHFQMQQDDVTEKLRAQVMHEQRAQQFAPPGFHGTGLAYPGNPPPLQTASPIQSAMSLLQERLSQTGEQVGRLMQRLVAARVIFEGPAGDRGSAPALPAPYCQFTATLQNMTRQTEEMGMVVSMLLEGLQL